jgi:hypothetical protein
VKLAEGFVFLPQAARVPRPVLPSCWILSGRQEHAQGFGSVSYIKDSLLLLVLSFAAGLGLHLCQVAAAGLCSRRKFTRGFGLRDLLFASRILLAGQF